MDNIRVLGAKSGIRSPYFGLASYAVLLAAFLWIPPAHATCPSDEGLRQLLNSEIQTATEGISSFQSILESRPLTNPISVTKLIFIDLNNETLVANRLGEIRKKLAAPELTLAERFPDCHQFTKPLMALQQAQEAQARQLLKLKATFLALPRDRRQQLLESYNAHLAQVEVSKGLTDAKEQAAKNLKEGIREQEQAQKEARSARDETVQKLAAERARVEQARVELSEEHLRIANRLQELNKEFVDLLAMTQKAWNEAEHLQVADLKSQFSFVNSLWRKEVDSSLKDRFQAELPEVPPLDLSLLSDGSSPELKEYEEAYKSLIEYRTDVLDQVQIANTQQRLNRYRLLVQLGLLRSLYLAKLRENGDETGYLLSNDVLADYLRELQVVPFRFFAAIRSKLTELQSAREEGVSGIVHFARDSFVFIVFLLIPVALFWLLSKIPYLLETFRIHLVRPPHHRNRKRVRAALTVQRLGPYVPWVLSYLAVLLARDLIEGTLWEEINLILPYVRYYIVYRVFLLLFQNLLLSLVRLGRFPSPLAIRKKGIRTGQSIGFFFLLAFSLRYATATTVGEALVYRFVEHWMYLLGILLFFVGAFLWRKEVQSAGERLGSDRLAAIFPKLCSGKFSPLGSGVAVLLLVSVVSWQKLAEELSELETFKKLSAKVMRKRLEATGKHGDKENIEALPEEYTKWFDYGVPTDEEIWVEPPHHIHQKIIKEISAWVNEDAEENTLAIFGEKGAGKSSLFELIARSKKEGVSFRKETVPPKLHTREATLEFFSKLMGVDITSGYSELIDGDASRKKTVYLLDDAHNFFLADIGGFEGFRAFLELTNIRLKNTFWAAAFNVHSWNYLDSVFGKNRFFRTLIPLVEWSEEEIQNMILSRHRKSQFKLAYEKVVFAAQGHRGDFEDYAETTYFRLLWEQASGNPRSAIYLWLSSLTRAGGTIRVALPEDTDPEAFLDLQQDALFVYAAIVRHENLSTEEAIEVTDLGEGVVRHAIKVGMERSFLFRAGGRYRVSAGWHNTLVSFLTKRNYIYGN